ncbi:MAG: glycine cleavage system protein R [Gammaproteobacteria bacterium]|nr:glycine cleavage system protein R [Gammaproteobacteria bacterium]
MENCLVITALGQDRPGIVSDLSQAILDTGCNILDSRMTVLGGEFAILLMVSGNWNAIAKLESGHKSLGQKFELTVTTKRTNDRSARPELLPYAVDVVSIDHPGIVNQLAGFFSERNINIEDLRTDCYSAPHTGTPMFTVSLVIGIPAATHIASLREQFISFCDEYNLDAILEPVKA